MPSPWWSKPFHADRRPLLLARGRIMAAVRGYFLDQGFIEVETAALQVSPGNEAHLHAFATDLENAAADKVRRYLHTSPEFAMKKLLAAGERRIFSFARVFRNREAGALHHPEFTMLEWYRADEPYERLMVDCGAILQLAADIGGLETWRHAGTSCDPRIPPRRISMNDAFADFAGFPLLEAAFRNGAPDRDAFAAAAARAGLRISADDSWSDMFSKILVERIEPGITPPLPIFHGEREGVRGGSKTERVQPSAPHPDPLPALRGEGEPSYPVILDAYPACEAALAKRSARDPRVTERFELFAAGVELANAFGEETDPAEQRRRLEAEMALKQKIYGQRYPIDEDFLAALAHMPPAAGAAMGFDRLVMLATGAQTIAQVIWTPVALG